MIQEKTKYCKKILLIVLLIIGIIIGILIPLIIVSTNYEETNPTLSNLMGVFAGVDIALGLIGIIIYSIYASKKTKKLDIKIILESINKRELKEEFIDIEDNTQKCSFTSEGLLVNDYLIPYEKVGGLYTNKTISNIWMSYSQFQLIIGDNTDEDSPDYDENIDYTERCVTILVTKDVLELIKKYDIKIANQEHLDYFMNNQEAMIKYIKSPNKLGNSYFPIYLPINNEIKKEFKKENSKALIISIVVILFSIGIALLLAFLSKTEKGVEISQFIGLNLIIKLIFSAGITFAAFYKRKDSLKPANIYTKILLLSSLAAYWIALLINSKLNYFIIYLLGLILLGYSVYSYVKLDRSGKDYTRTGVIGGIFFIVLLMSLFDINYVGGDYIFIFSIIIAGIISVIAIIIGILYYIKFYNKDNEKNKKISYWIGLILGSIMISIAFSISTIQTINYSFDASEAVITQYEIINKDISSGENTYYYLYLEGMEEKITVDNETYFDCEIGDIIELYQYNGALGFSYYLYKFDTK